MVWVFAFARQPNMLTCIPSVRYLTHWMMHLWPSIGKFIFENRGYSGDIFSYSGSSGILGSDRKAEYCLSRC